MSVLLTHQNDVLLGQIAIHNKVTTTIKMEACLNRQECLHLMGVEMGLADIMIEQKVINPQQRTLLQRAQMQFLLDRFDEFFFKTCEANNLLSVQEINEAKQYKGAGHKECSSHYAWTKKNQRRQKTKNIRQHQALNDW